MRGNLVAYWADKAIKTWCLLKSQAFWTLIFCLVAGNLFWQGYPRSAINNFENWDNQQICFMSSPPSVFGVVHGADVFHTYGPLFPWLNLSVGPFELRNNYYTVWTWMAVWLGMMVQFLRSCPNRWVFPLATFTLCFFNFPALRDAPWLIVLWSLTTPRSKGAQQLHGVLGILYVSSLILHKFSFGFIAFVQWLLVECWRAYKNGSIVSLIRKLIMLMLWVLFLYGLSTGSWSLGTFSKYVLTSWQSSTDYAELMQTPLSFTTGWLFGAWPFILLLVLLGFLFFKSEYPRFYLLLVMAPVSFAAYKHSYTRCDVSNLMGTFFMTGVLMFALHLRFFNHRTLRFYTGAVLLLLTFSTWMDWLPYNTPWRHPRLFWLRSPWQDAALAVEAQQRSRLALEDYLQKNQWVTDHLQGATVLNLPVQVFLNLHAQKGVYLSHFQSYFTWDGGEDLGALAADKVLYQHTLHDRRYPMSNNPNIMVQLMEHYRIEDRKDDMFILNKRECPQKPMQVETHWIELQNGSAELVLHSSEERAFFVQAQNLRGLSYRLKSLLLRGDRVIFGVGSWEYVVSVATLERGFWIVPMLESQKLSDPLELSFRGLMSQRATRDPGRLWPVEISGKLKVEVWQQGLGSSRGK